MPSEHFAFEISFVQTPSILQLLSSQSVNPFPSLSMPSEHAGSEASAGQEGVPAHEKSSQSMKPFPSLSQPSLQAAAVFSFASGSHIAAPVVVVMFAPVEFVAEVLIEPVDIVPLLFEVEEVEAPEPPPPLLVSSVPPLQPQRATPIPKIIQDARVFMMLLIPN